MRTEYITAFLSILLFLFFYGFQCLCVTNTDWLMTGGDLSQHYLGWKFYRFSAWQFPIGLMDTIAYPFRESVLFTDSIPLFAVLFKVLSPILPEQFQYFGLWGLMCFVLQGVIACNICKKYLTSAVSQVAGGLLAVLTPCMLRRMYWHTSLGGQWILLLCLWCMVYQREKLDRLWKGILAWTVIGMLSVSIHVYFVPMCGIFLLGFLVQEFFLYHKAGRIVGILSGFFAGVLLSLWLLGGFCSGMESGAPGLAYYSFNLNGFFNPQEWDCILPRLHNYAEGQFEGFAYLGMGVLLLLFLTAGMQIFRSIRKTQRISWKAVLIVSGMIFLSVFAAASNEIACGSRLLLKIPVSGWIEKLWSVFRSTGRLVWPAVYLLTFYGICGNEYSRNRKYWKYLLGFCVLLQILDLSGAVRLQARDVRSGSTYQTLLTDDFWEQAADAVPRKHVVMMDKDNMSQEQLYAVADYASEHFMSINDFYFARNWNSPAEAVAHDFAMHPAEDTLYLFTTKSFFESGSYPLSYYQVNGFLVGMKTPLADRECISPGQYNSYHMDFEGENLIQGEDREHIRYLYEEGVSYGPFLHLEPGNYRVTAAGNHLDEAEVSIYSDGGGTTYEYETVSMDESRMEFTFVLQNPAEDWEINIKNKGKELEIADICIKRE